MKLHSQIKGKGESLLILHGFLGMGDNWTSLSKLYANTGYEVHLIDMRNHGKSPHSDDFNYHNMANDIFIYCQDHNITKANVIGHSMGGKIAMNFAAKHPSLVNRLIVVDISPRYYKPHHDDILNSLKMLNDKKISSRREADALLESKIEGKGMRLFLLKNLKREKDNTLTLKPNLDTFIKHKENIGEALESNLIYKGETLFIKGENSDYITSRDKSLINLHFPNHKIVSIKNAGHWVHAENPKVFFEESTKFMNLTIMD